MRKIILCYANGKRDDVNSSATTIEILEQCS